LVRPREDNSIKEANTKPGTPRDTILITVKYLGEDDDQHEGHCKMTETMSFDKLISLYSKRWNVDASAQRLTFNGKTVFPSDTPALVSHQSSSFPGQLLTILRLAQSMAPFSVSQRTSMSVPWTSLSIRRSTSSHRSGLVLVHHIHLCTTTKPAEHSNNDSHDISKTLTTSISERETSSKILVLPRKTKKSRNITAARVD
jgi:hypothetical protein